jgi:hypothetical protein
LEKSREKGKSNMFSMRSSVIALLGCSLVSAGNFASATVFFSDEFAYEPGQLTAADSMSPTGTGANVSGGLWTSHSGITEFMQAVGGPTDEGYAEVKISGTEDISRSTGSTLSDGSTWYYAARMTFVDNRLPEDTGAIGTNYFMHFKDESTFNLLGRLYVAPPTAAESRDYTLALSSYSVNGTGGQQVRWGSDLTFGSEYIVVVSIKSRDTDGGTTDDGYSSLWVNPVDVNSTSITDTMPHPDLFIDPDRSDMTRLALRQQNAGNNQPTVQVDEVAIGDSFSEVLAAVTAAAPAVDADFDGDLDVDGDDFLIWQRGLGTGTANADGNTDGDTDVDATDLANWKAKFGLPVATPVAAAVPEPACASLLAIGLGVLARRRRR